MQIRLPTQMNTEKNFKNAIKMVQGSGFLN